MKKAQRKGSASGFTLLELVIGAAVMLVVLAMAIPTVQKAMQSFHTAGDVRGIAAQLALAKMRAAADFTDTRVNFNNFTLSQTTGTYQYQLEVYNSATTSWAIDQTGGKNSGVQNLSSNTLYGFSTITTPAGTQSPISNSNLIAFNSRGIPVTGTPPNLTATGSYAVYLNNGTGQYFAVTVSPSGNIQMWQMNGTLSTWHQFY